jgi:hypothetical protein
MGGALWRYVHKKRGVLIIHSFIHSSQYTSSVPSMGCYCIAVETSRIKLHQSIKLHTCMLAWTEHVGCPALAAAAAVSAHPHIKLH